MPLNTGSGQEKGRDETSERKKGGVRGKSGPQRLKERCLVIMGTRGVGESMGRDKRVNKKGEQEG